MSQYQSSGHALVAAGSNLPNGTFSPPATLRHALSSLGTRGWRANRVSRFYSNPAWPPESGAPDYVNAVFALEGEGTAHELLDLLHEIEALHGRSRGRRYLSRTLDLDLLACGDLVLPDAATVRRWIEAEGAAREAVPPELILPHPRLHERAFVLVPLAEVAPEWRHPVLGRTARDLADALPAEARDSLKPL